MSVSQGMARNQFFISFFTPEVGGIHVPECVPDSCATPAGAFGIGLAFTAYVGRLKGTAFPETPAVVPDLLKVCPAEIFRFDPVTDQ